MSFLDEIFGTDGRKHKDEGIWNWVKNQRIKRKLKKAEQAAALHNNHPTTPPVSSTFSSASSATGGHTHTHTHNLYYHQHHHPESTQHTRPLSVSSAASTSHASFYCSPRSPTSTFTPSTTPSTAYSSPRDSAYFRRPASVNSSTTTAVGSTTPPMDVYNSPKAHQLPYTHSRQRAQSTFTLPAIIVESSSAPRRSASSRQQRSQHSDDYRQSYNPRSQHINGYYDDDEGPIRRSASSRSAPTCYYSQSQPQFQSRHLQQQQVEDEDYANLCSIESLSNSGQSSPYNSSSGSTSSSSSNKGKGIQRERDQEETIDEITEVDDEDSSIGADSILSSPSSTTNPGRRRSMVMVVDDVSDSSTPQAARRRSESTLSFHHKKEDGWWWE